MARHDAPGGLAAAVAQRNPRVIALAIALVVLAVAAILLAIRIADPSGARGLASGCAAPSSLRVVANPLIAPALAEIADESAGERCAVVDVTERSSAQMADEVAAGTAPEFDLWVPDSLAWFDSANRQALAARRSAPGLQTSDKIASSPIVVATTAGTAADLDLARAGWATLAAGSVSIVFPDPATNAASLGGLISLRDALAAQEPRDFTSAVLDLRQRLAPTVEEAFAAVVDADEPTVTVTSEADAAAYNATDPDSPMTAIYPDDAAVALGFVLVRPSSADAEVATAVYELQRAIGESVPTLGRYGLRIPNGQSSPSGTGIEEAEIAVTVPSPGNEEAMAATWSTLTSPSRILNVIDVSGSMAEPTPTGRRIDIFRDGFSAALSSGDPPPVPGSQAGIWVFSTNRSADQDWQEILPFGELDSAPFQTQLAATTGSLDTLVGGATGLYDTVLAAARYLRSTYDPARANTLLLATDGRNEDANSIDLPTLLDELGATVDPARPISLVLVGFGPDADMAVLQQIAYAGKGTVYQALEPTDIGSVLTEAIAQRGCRPICGVG